MLKRLFFALLLFVAGSAWTAQALQASISAVVTGAIVTPVYNRNAIDIDLPATASVSLSGTVTGGASQATVTQDTTYSMSVAQMGRAWVAPVNASVFALSGGTGAGAQGGAWSSQTFKGRLQIFAASSTAQVTVMGD